MRESGASSVARLSLDCISSLPLPLFPSSPSARKKKIRPWTRTTTPPRPTRATAAAAPSRTREAASMPPSRPTASPAWSSPGAPRRGCRRRCRIPPPPLPLSLPQRPMEAKSLAVQPGSEAPRPGRAVEGPLRRQEAAWRPGATSHQSPSPTFVRFRFFLKNQSSRRFSPPRPSEERKKKLTLTPSSSPTPPPPPPSPPKQKNPNQPLSLQPLHHLGLPPSLWSPRPRLRPLLGGPRAPLGRRAPGSGRAASRRLRHAQVRRPYRLLRQAQPGVAVPGGVPARRARGRRGGQVVEEGRERAGWGRGRDEVDGARHRAQVCLREVVSPFVFFHLLFPVYFLLFGGRNLGSACKNGASVL